MFTLAYARFEISPGDLKRAFTVNLIVQVMENVLDFAVIIFIITKSKTFALKKLSVTVCAL